VVTRQQQVERKTAKVRLSEADVLPLCHATNYLADHDKIFTVSTDHEYAFVGGPVAPQQIQDGGGRHL